MHVDKLPVLGNDRFTRSQQYGQYAICTRSTRLHEERRQPEFLNSKAVIGGFAVIRPPNESTKE